MNMSDYTDLVEDHGMKANDPNAIDRLIDMYSDEEEDNSQPCVICGEGCYQNMVTDAGHNAWYLIQGIDSTETQEDIDACNEFYMAHDNQGLVINMYIHEDCWPFGVTNSNDEDIIKMREHWNKQQEE